MLSHRLWRFSVLLFLTTIAVSSALEVGDGTLDLVVSKASDGGAVKLSDFHGKSNVVLANSTSLEAEFIFQLESKTEAFKAKYDTTIIPFKPESMDGTKEAFIIDKSGYVRWKSGGDSNSAHPTIEQLETELAKLKRSKPLPIGSPAPDFSLTETDGKTVFTLSTHKGKKNVLVTLLLQTY